MKNRLRVLFFNYIPHAAEDKNQTLIKRIKSDFEVLHPSIELEISPISYNYDLYDIEQLRELFVNHDLIEVDATLMLEWLLKYKLISPFDTLPSRAWHSSALESIYVNGSIYGVPSWMCSHFVLARKKQIQYTGSLAKNIIKNRGRAIFDYSGNWSKLGLYLDGILDEYNNINFENLKEFNEDILENMSTILKSCSNELCKIGNYSDTNLAVEHFIDSPSESTFLIGYFESLMHHLSKKGVVKSDFIIDTLRLSEKNESLPILFIDAWVKSKSCVDKTCNDMAFKFTNYITHKDTQHWIISSGDAYNSKPAPRYLIPANSDTLYILNDNFYDLKYAYSILKDAKSIPQACRYAHEMFWPSCPHIWTQPVLQEQTKMMH